MIHMNSTHLNTDQEASSSSTSSTSKTQEVKSSASTVESWIHQRVPATLVSFTSALSNGSENVAQQHQEAKLSKLALIRNIVGGGATSLRAGSYTVFNVVNSHPLPTPSPPPPGSPAWAPSLNAPAKK